MSIPVPTNEEERLTALHQLGILDTKPEAAFDRITEHAQTVFDVSAAAVTLIDQDRQWFKSACGWDVEETSRESSFCTYAILDDGVMVVEDAIEDDRFHSNPLVVGEDGLRFYAGAPLVIEDEIRVGSLCLLDEQSRSFDAEEQKMLATLADVVVDLLKAHKQTYEIGYLSSALEQARDAVVITEANPIDPPGPRIVWANKAFSRMTGYDVEEVLGETPRIFQGPETDRSVLNKVRIALENERAVYAETVNYQKDGSPYVVAWHIAPVYAKDDTLTHWVSVQRDVTDEQRREERLKHEATHDTLTGLPNRYAIQKEIRRALDEPTDDRAGVLLYVDLDEFKPVNDELGHKVGDQILIQTGEVLRQVMRRQDTIGRIGGDEFVVCLPGIESPSEAHQIAERLHDALSQPFSVGPHEITVTASIGGTLHLSAYDTVEDALHAADVAMYQAKGSADCTIVLQDPFAEREPDACSMTHRL
jgi:diguanylate cyclase (GGDEF)-like protein/PAS domain S-box-containing protein